MGTNMNVSEMGSISSFDWVVMCTPYSLDSWSFTLFIWCEVEDRNAYCFYPTTSSIFWYAAAFLQVLKSWAQVKVLLLLDYGTEMSSLAKFKLLLCSVAQKKSLCLPFAACDFHSQHLYRQDDILALESSTGCGFLRVRIYPSADHSEGGRPTSDV